jgi:hypothetical protein
VSSRFYVSERTQDLYKCERFAAALPCPTAALTAGTNENGRMITMRPL